jgi:GTPase-associated system helical domain
MTEFDFADRYAQAGLQPTPETIAARQASAARVRENVNKEQLLDLVSAYYGLKPDLIWFRDEFRKEDSTFSLIANERESIVLAAIILAGKVANSDPVSILGIIAGSAQGKRAPTEATWLLDEARSAMLQHAATARAPLTVGTEIRSSTAPKIGDKIGDEIKAAPSDLSALAQVLGKVRDEGQEVARSLALQVSDALVALTANARHQREESQILWWLFGEHSRSLNKPFSAFRPAQAALIGGIELGELTTASKLGPVAAPAVLERVLRVAKKDNKAQRVALMAAVDGLGAGLAELKPLSPKRPGICPVLAAIGKAREIGSGAWGNAFQKATGLEPAIEFEPIELALQIYQEHLLGIAE